MKNNKISYFKDST